MPEFLLFIYEYFKNILHTRLASRTNRIQVIEQSIHSEASYRQSGIEIVSTWDQNILDERVGTRPDRIFILEQTLIQKIDEISQNVNKLEEGVGVRLSKLEEANIAIIHQINGIITTVNKNNRTVRNSFRVMHR